MNIVLLIFFTLISAINSSQITANEICTKELEKVVHCYESNAFIFMRRMHLALLDDGTTSVLIKRFSQKYDVIVKASDAFGTMTSITVPVGMELYVTPSITGPVKDVTAMRAYALGTAFDDNAPSGLLVYSATIINSSAKMILITIYAPKTKYSQCDLNMFGL